MLIQNLGYPRIGTQRQLKKALENYWTNKIDQNELEIIISSIKINNWRVQQDAEIDLIPCNDFSLYDHILDTSCLLGVIPARYEPIRQLAANDLELYFAMARGYQKNGMDVTALEMTKWLDTNYHYLVPEFTADQTFHLAGDGVFREYLQAREIVGNRAKPVLTGPVSYLLLGKEKEDGFSRIDLIDRLVPVYVEILRQLGALGAEWVQLDEPTLCLDLSPKEQEAFTRAYVTIASEVPSLKILVATYFETLGNNLPVAAQLPVRALHVDLVRGEEQLDIVLETLPKPKTLSLGLVDGRNIWKNDYQKSLSMITRAIEKLGAERVIIAPSCSLLHCPVDLTTEKLIDPEIRGWMAFSRQKLEELNDLKKIVLGNIDVLETNQSLLRAKGNSSKGFNLEVRKRASSITPDETVRKSDFDERRKIQKSHLNLPLFPTTTIGSFPQTREIRRFRARLKKGELTQEQYKTAIRQEIQRAVKWQDELQLDVLVHGEFERNDMVEYFGEQLEGFLFTQNGWVQSYGSRCVKPPVIYGDVSRPNDMTVDWTTFAASLTERPMKGMLTGPITILQWSFARNDQPREHTARQIALAIRDEVLALEKAGIKIIQIDEAALREGLPLRRAQHASYLKWAIEVFRIASSAVKDETQIHTHMCYSEFNDIIEYIALMDADVITIETSRSQMELLESFVDFNYPNEIGPGVYDIHSPRIPTVEEIFRLLVKAASFLPVDKLWINPDCGLKTRQWPETCAALKNMIEAAKLAREKLVPR